MKLSVFILVLSLLLIVQSKAEKQANRTELLGAYIYNFAKLSDSPIKRKSSTYNIILITRESQLISEFKKLSEAKTIDGKSIKVTTSSSSQFDKNGISLAFIAKDMKAYCNKIFKMTKNTNILLVSEEYKDKLKVILNLYQASDGSFRFEMNRANLYERSIRINDEVLLMGGSQLDNYALYQENQAKYNREITQKEKQLKNIKNQTSEAQKKLGEKEQLLADQKKEIKGLVSEKDSLHQDIDSLNQAIAQQEESFGKRITLYQNIYQGLMKAHDRIENQNNEIEKSDETLSMLKRQLQAMDSELNDKNKVIQGKEVKISESNNLIVILSVVSFIIGCLLILLLISRRKVRRQNLQLAKQKEAISKHNHVLSQNNLELQEKRAMIEEKNNLINDLNHNLEERIELKTLELTDTINHLNKTVSELDRFIYSTSHELSAPLKSVLGLINIAKIDQSNNHQEYYQLIETSVLKLEDTIKSFVTFSRNSRQEIQNVECNLHLITSEIIEDMKFYDQTTKIDIQIKITEDIFIISDSMRLKIILSNLISNAIKYHDPQKENKWLKITYARSSESHIISIIDNGIGISNNQLDKIFEKFFRASSRSTGTGLGLYIVKDAVDHLQGTIQVKSDEGQGTEFVIELPFVVPIKSSKKKTVVNQQQNI
ncbi:YfiR/HmsC family protein [Reichenbachiella versicolor]|uniref:YfiR/HmsC family protein n=1 Tax=Reichenbachiella versicolor TaxID=1821036 RepID=UPI000D6E3EC4|nr:YfiR/HmsC family protein [Reichenbachiella versicolor]